MIFSLSGSVLFYMRRFKMYSSFCVSHMEAKLFLNARRSLLLLFVIDVARMQFTLLKNRLAFTVCFGALLQSSWRLGARIQWPSIVTCFAFFSPICTGTLHFSLSIVDLFFLILSVHVHLHWSVRLSLHVPRVGGSMLKMNVQFVARRPEHNKSCIRL